MGKVNGISKLTRCIIHLLCRQVTFRITGTVLQLVALFSNSWFLVTTVNEKCNHYVRKYDPVFICKDKPLIEEEIARAGLWKVCYAFPYLPVGHTDPYCADFAEDNYPEPWQSRLQFVCTLSLCLSVMGHLTEGIISLFPRPNQGWVWTGSGLIVTGGILGFIGVVYSHMCMTIEYLVYYKDLELYIYWGFHLFLDGALFNLFYGLMFAERRRQRELVLV